MFYNALTFCTSFVCFFLFLFLFCSFTSLLFDFHHLGFSNFSVLCIPLGSNSHFFCPPVYSKLVQQAKSSSGVAFFPSFSWKVEFLLQAEVGKTGGKKGCLLEEDLVLKFIYLFILVA